MIRLESVVSWFFTYLGVTLLGVSTLVVPSNAFADGGTTSGCMMTCLAMPPGPDRDNCMAFCCNFDCNGDPTCGEGCCQSACGADPNCYATCLAAVQAKKCAGDVACDTPEQCEWRPGFNPPRCTQNMDPNGSGGIIMNICQTNQANCKDCLCKGPYRRGDGMPLSCECE